MKLFMPFKKEEQVIARFGGAELVRDQQGRVELRGGAPSDFGDATHTCSCLRAVNEVHGSEANPGVAG